MKIVYVNVFEINTTLKNFYGVLNCNYLFIMKNLCNNYKKPCVLPIYKENCTNYVPKFVEFNIMFYFVKLMIHLFGKTETFQ